MAEKEKIFLHNINFLPIAEKLKSLLVFISFRCQKGIFKQSDSKIAGIFGVTDRSIRTWIHELAKEDWISINNPGDPRNRTIQITKKTLEAIQMNTQELIDKTEENFRIDQPKDGRNLPNKEGKKLPNKTEEIFQARRKFSSNGAEENFLQNNNEDESNKMNSKKEIGFTSFLSVLKEKSFMKSLQDNGFDLSQVQKSIDRFLNVNEKKTFKTEDHLRNTFLEFHGKKIRKKRDSQREEYLSSIEKSLNYFSVGQSIAQEFGVDWNQAYQKFIEYCLLKVPVIENENHPIILFRQFLESSTKVHS